MHWDGADNDWRFVGNSLLVLGRRQGSGKQTDQERQPEQGLMVHYTEERSQRGLPAAKCQCLGHLSRKYESAPTEASTVLVLGYLGRVLRGGNRMQSSNFPSVVYQRKIGGSEADRWEILTPSAVVESDSPQCLDRPCRSGADLALYLAWQHR